MRQEPFRSDFARRIWAQKYAQGPNDSWPMMAKRLVEDVCGKGYGKHRMQLMSNEEMREIEKFITEMKFIPAGRYLYYAGRDLNFFNNCLTMKCEEDSREEWGRVVHRAISALMSGAGIGVEYSPIRPGGYMLSRTGGIASGPIPLMHIVNESGRNVMQGGSRRSAIMSILSWLHEDVNQYIHMKDWPQWMVEAKAQDFNFPAPMDMTNISVSWNTDFIEQIMDGGPVPDLWYETVEQMCKTGEPGHLYNFWDKEDETGRNAPVSADTWIMTVEGYKQVRDIVDKPEIVWTGVRWAEDVVFKKTKSNVETVEVQMTGRRSIKADPEHEFFVERYSGKGKSRKKLNKIERVPAGQLQTNDILHTSVPIAKLDGVFSKNNYTLGFIFGDGTFNKDGSSELTLCTEEKIQCFSYMDENAISSYTYPDSRGYCRVYFLPKFFGQYDKTTCPYFASNHELSSFMAGLFDADGHYDKSRQYIRLSNNSIKFLESVRRNLEMLGIYSNIVNGCASSGYSGTRNYNLEIAAGSVRVFELIIPTKRLKINASNYIPYRQSHIRVKNVNQGPVEDVYCCNVGYKEHSFCAEGVIISNCGELTSEDDSDPCNLGAVNFSRIESIQELARVTHLASKFLVCGALRADLPYGKVYETREMNMRIGLGVMGLHEWLIKRGYRYEPNEELANWLMEWRYCSEQGANEHCDRFYLNRPKGYRAIAPTGTIGSIASTTTGIEPIFATAYKRRYLVDGTKWRYEYVIDATAENILQESGVDPRDVETAYTLAEDPERRVAFQAWVQQFVDHAISSTVNLPEWGSEQNNPDKAKEFSGILLQHCKDLRGITVYPEGARGGQPITPVPYDEAKNYVGTVFDEQEERCWSGHCGL